MDQAMHVVPGSLASNLLKGKTYIMNDYNGDVKTRFDMIKPLSGTFPMQIQGKNL